MKKHNSDCSDRSSCSDCSPSVCIGFCGVRLGLVWGRFGRGPVGPTPFNKTLDRAGSNTLQHAHTQRRVKAQKDLAR